MKNTKKFDDTMLELVEILAEDNYRLNKRLYAISKKNAKRRLQLRQMTEALKLRNINIQMRDFNKITLQEKHKRELEKMELNVFNETMKKLDLENQIRILKKKRNSDAVIFSVILILSVFATLMVNAL